jgi:hypothetical protein
MDAATELALIDAALIALYQGGAQSYSIGSRSVTKLDHKSLVARKNELLTILQRSSGSGAFSVAKMGRRR